MLLLIDAYNVIRFLRPGEPGLIEREILWFLKMLRRYVVIKQREMRCEVLVVFDGGLFAHKTREIVSGVPVVYAGKGRCADDVLVEYAEQYREGAVLVSNDRRLAERALHFRTQRFDVPTFWQMVEAVCAREMPDVPGVMAGPDEVVKYVSPQDDEYDDLAAQMVDQLMRDTPVAPGLTKKDEKVPTRTSGTATGKKERAEKALRKKWG